MVLAWSFVTLATEQLSPVVGAVNVTTAEQLPKSLVTDTADEQLMLGASLSVTVTVCVHVFVLP